MTDASAQGSAKVVIPDELRKKFPEIINLILASESMNDEERQYWVNILPIMTPEQVQNLRDILENERKQLQAIDQKYSKQLSASASKEQVIKTETDRTKRRQELKQKEQTIEQKEEQQTKELLDKIENL